MTPASTGAATELRRANRSASSGERDVLNKIFPSARKSAAFGAIAGWVNRFPSRRSSAALGTAKFSCCPPSIVAVVMPTKFPRSSNRPPPLEPSEMAADTCNRVRFLRRLRLETNPSASVFSRPWGEPIVKTRSPTTGNSTLRGEIPWNSPRSIWRTARSCSSSAPTRTASPLNCADMHYRQHIASCATHNMPVCHDAVLGDDDNTAKLLPRHEVADAR